MEPICLPGCAPAQVVNLNVAVNDVTAISVFDLNGNEYCKDNLQYSYSLDGTNWSCYMSYDDILSILVDVDSDYYIRIKVNGSVGAITYDGDSYSDYNTTLFQCFDFSNLVSTSTNLYNPYANMDYAMGLYQALTENVVSMLGIPIYYFKLSPNKGSADITFKEYALMDVESVKQIKMMVTDGQMPSSKPEFTEFGLDFQTDWETELSKAMFASAFGNSAQPMEGDLVYVPMMQRMWMVNGAYDEKKDGLMWKSTTFKITLVKYQQKGSVDLGDAQTLVDSFVKNKYEDLFGDQENLDSSEATTEPPVEAYNPAYPVYESDAVRKYVKCSNGLVDINARLINSPKYHKGTLISENMYDWSTITEQSYIIYQRQYCGDVASISFIITLNQVTNESESTLLKIADIPVILKQRLKSATISVTDAGSISLVPGNTYFVWSRWSKEMNLFELHAAKYTYPQSIPLYKLQDQHWRFDFDNTIDCVKKYSVELFQESKKDVIMNSFNGKITNIKLFDVFVNNDTELLQMNPTNQHLLINDNARKIVDMNGVSVF